MKAVVLGLLLLAVGVLSATPGNGKEKISFMKYCPPVPQSSDPNKETVDSKCTKYYNAGAAIVDARNAAGNDANTIIDRVKCLTQRLSNNTPSILSVCFKKGLTDRALYYQRRENTSQGGAPSAKNIRRGVLG